MGLEAHELNEIHELSETRYQLKYLATSVVEPEIKELGIIKV